MNRKNWIKAVYEILIETGATGGKQTKEWAESLAKTYYDECPNEYTPKEAVEDDYSYA